MTQIAAGQVKGDGEPTCFSNAKDTGIPELQQWCRQLTLSPRERAARNFLAHLTTFLTSVQSHVRGIEDVAAVDREALRTKWEARNGNTASQSIGIAPRLALVRFSF